MPARLEPVFLDGFQAGRRFALWVSPPAGCPDRGSLLCVQPFGEEANLSRRVLVAQAVRLANAGWTTLILDTYGTGDSDGATQDATLEIWQADLLRASRLARERVAGPFVLWGTRLGTLLAAELAIALDQLASGLVFWQPVARGAQLMDPLLKLARLGAAARGAAAGGGAAGDATSPGGGASTGSGATGASLRGFVPAASPGLPSAGPSSSTGASPAATPQGIIDLAGYRLRRDLVDGLGNLAMQPPVLGEHSAPCPVLMLGIQRVHATGSPAPKPLGEVAERWLDEGYLASLRVVQGEPFWASLEPSTPLAAFEAMEAFLEMVDGRA